MKDLMNYQLYDVKDAAALYIEEILLRGKNLSQLILEQVSFAEGTTLAILPADFDGTDVEAFEMGGKFSQAESEAAKSGNSGYFKVRKPNCSQVLALISSRFLQRNEQAVCIFEDALALSTDPWVQGELTKNELPLKTLENSVFYIITSKAFDNVEFIERMIRKSGSVYHFVCLFSLSPPNIVSHLDTSMQVTRQVLKDSIKGAQAVVIGAYDGESYLIWTQRKAFLTMLQEMFTQPAE